MAESLKSGLVQAAQVAREAEVRQAANGLRYAAFGETGVPAAELARVVQAVPAAMTGALGLRTYYFVPLVLGEGRGAEAGHRGGREETMIAPAYSVELADAAICHRNVELGSGAGEGVFISTRLMGDRFGLNFEFFINVAHAFVDEAGVAEAFAELAWGQAAADVRGETSVDAWESRGEAMGGASESRSGAVSERAKGEYVEAAFSDAIAIYLLSLSLDFDYSELREREYPLLAPQALAERLRMVAGLFPPNAEYEFAIRYRRRGEGEAGWLRALMRAKAMRVGVTRDSSNVSTSILAQPM
jgi:hypothetical protein